MRYEISDQALKKILNDLGNAAHYELEDSLHDSFNGMVIDTGKLYLYHVIKTIAYTAKVSLNADWDKDWEITIAISD